MIETDLRAALIGEATISSIIGTRMFLVDPIKAPTQTYISYAKISRARDMVSDQSRFRLILYSKDMSELLSLESAIITYLENRRTLNSNPYYSLSFVNQNNGATKLDDGFYWSMLEYEFKNTT